MTDGPRGFDRTARGSKTWLALGGCLLLGSCALFEEIGKQRCEADESRPCNCDGGGAGSQTCSANRTSWDACVCQGTGDASIDDGAAPRDRANSDVEAGDRARSDLIRDEGAVGDTAARDNGSGDRVAIDRTATDGRWTDVVAPADTSIHPDNASSQDSAVRPDTATGSDRAAGADTACSETDQEFCANHSIRCSSYTGLDSCGVSRTAVCGDCNLHGSCAGGVCTCYNDWDGLDCEHCEPGRWGAACNHTCTCVHGICEGNDATETSGWCVPLSCEVNWTGTNCDDCVAGRWGASCGNLCTCVHGTCEDGPTGDGQCVAGSCSNNWTGGNCDLCPGNYTGVNCDSCSANYWGATCANACTCVNGSCRNGYTGDGHCVPGSCVGNWRGTDCTIDCSSGICDLGDGTVYVVNGNLVFMKCSHGQILPSCTGTANNLLFCNSYESDVCDDGSFLDGSGTSSAVWPACNAFNTSPPGGFGGHTGWRAPALNELRNLYTAYTGSGGLLPNTVQDVYWTNQVAAAGMAWGVSFATGAYGSYPQDDNKPVRCVRPGP